MAVEIKIGDRVALANLISKKGNILEVDIDGKRYSVDLMQTGTERIQYWKMDTLTI